MAKGSEEEEERPDSQHVPTNRRTRGPRGRSSLQGLQGLPLLPAPCHHPRVSSRPFPDSAHHTEHRAVGTEVFSVQPVI